MGEGRAPDDLEAVTAVVKALRPFDDQARQRIVDSALTLLGTTMRRADGPPRFGSSTPGAAEGDSTDRHDVSSAAPPRDVRELRNEKRPRTANEMAAVVAYYVAKLAPLEDRRDFIRSADVTKYFEQAGYLQPSDASMTLVNAKNAGYFDSLGGGKYRLNPVGLNLVTHGLPKAVPALLPLRPRARRIAKKTLQTSRKTRKR